MNRSKKIFLFVILLGATANVSLGQLAAPFGQSSVNEWKESGKSFEDWMFDKKPSSAWYGIEWQFQEIGDTPTFIFDLGLVYKHVWFTKKGIINEYYEFDHGAVLGVSAPPTVAIPEPATYGILATTILVFLVAIRCYKKKTS